MRLLVALLLLALWSPARAQNIGPLDARNNLAEVNPATALSNLGFTRLNIRAGCSGLKALGDGTTDDSAAIAACITLANTLTGAGTHVVIYAPAGKYLIKGTQLPRIYLASTALIGDGREKTIFMVDPAYSYGAVFSWDESWLVGIPTQNTSNFNYNLDRLGARVEGLSIWGTNTAPTEQDALVFYDRNDFVLIRDVNVFFMNGQCLRAGASTLNTSFSYMRESEIWDFKCWESGTSTKAAVEISATGAGDTSNEIQMHGVNIFGATSVGMLIHNNNTSGKQTGAIGIWGLRIENSANDNLDIGKSGDSGATGNIFVVGAIFNSPGGSNTGYYNVNVGNGVSTQSYAVNLFGVILGPCGSSSCNGIRLDNTRNANIEIVGNSAGGTGAYGVTTTANTGQFYYKDGGTTEQYDTYSIGGTANYVFTPIYKSGNPTGNTSSNAPAVLTGRHDGSATFGNVPGIGAVDLETIRSAANQVAAALGSTTIAGQSNGIDPGATNAVAHGGQNNFLYGANSAAVGGQSGTDFHHLNSSVHGGAPFAGGLGTSQQEVTVLGCSAVAPSGTCRLTADHLTAGSTNCLNVPANSGVNLRIELVAHDYTSTSLAMWIWGMRNAALGRGSTGVGSTAFAAGATETAVSIGTTTGAAAATSADTTNGCLNLTFTAPSIGTDTWDATATVFATEAQ